MTPNSSPTSFVGVLESPLDGSPVLAGERVEVRGWALADPAIDAVEGRLDGGATAALETGFARADVGQAFVPGGPDAPRCGFTGWLDLAHVAPGAHELTVTARRGARAVHTWHRPLQVTTADEHYRHWRERLLARLPAPSRWASPLITWLVIADDDLSRAAEAAAALQAACAGTCAAWAFDRHTSPSMPRTPYVGVLHANDRLWPQAMEALRWGLPDMPAPDFVYADHDHADSAGAPHDPVFKPGWSPLLMRHPGLGARGWLVRTALLESMADLASLADTSMARPSHLASRCRSAWRLPVPLVTRTGADPAAPCSDAAPALAAPPITVVIPTRMADRNLLARCLDGVRADAAGREAEVVVVLNNLGDIRLDEARGFLARWSVHCLHDDGVFNWSRLNNVGAQEARGELLLFLNDDIEPLAPGSLSAMVALAAEPGIGAVGAVLRYPDGRLQHGGVYVHGGSSPECRHTFRHCSGHEPRVRRWLSHDRAQTAVTGACLLTPRAVYLSLGGFDEGFPLVFNDIDYCLRLAQRGWGCAVAAASQWRHHEGASRGGMAEHADHARFRSRWGGMLPICDPHSHPQLLRDRDDWMFDPGRLPRLAGSVMT